MKRSLATALVILLALLAGVACRSTPDAVETPGAAEPQAAATSTPTAEPQPTPLAAATPTPAPEEATEPPAAGTAQIYLVALDAAPEGEGIGCGDELVPVQVEVDPAAEPLEAALAALLAVDDEFYGQSGLYNALHQSDLTVAGVQVEDGTAFVALEGEVLLGGVCDTPRVQAQLEQTALAVEGIDEVELLLNGEPLRQVLAGEPVEQPTPGGPGAVGDVFMYMVLPENNGVFGPQFGCNDSLIPVLIDVDPTVEPLNAAVENLLRVESAFYGETQLYNALYASGLRLESAEIDEGVAHINLEGHVEIAGECDLPRFRTQLEQTALQFDTVEEVEITINGEPLETITGGAQGGLAPQAFAAARDQVLLFLVAPSAGGGFGCDDSLVAIQHEIDAPGTPLQAALEALLTLDPSVYEPLGLYSVFAQSDLTVEGVDIDNGVAEIALSGELMLGGVCDNPRVVDQITWTATQFDTVDSVVITLNGAPIEDALSLR